ncbi:hypothetical protein R1T40_03070 [Tritonibacter scottomollicae]|uniref:Uncharacterized protein n=1 Tax=Tritonibacter scottomollicae TaxID=483013 RepID=A0ABZ0HFZ8_TRISK|nr:hypothetical protein R1T40_03070 [Tritonibacter scottomollicae]
MPFQFKVIAFEKSYNKRGGPNTLQHINRGPAEEHLVHLRHRIFMTTHQSHTLMIAFEMSGDPGIALPEKYNVK